MRDATDKPNWSKRHAERGATMVEYSMIVALVVVGSLGAIKVLTNNAKKEIANQSSCVSKRPPPASCQNPAITTTTTVPIGPTSSTTAPPTTLPVTTTTQDPTKAVVTTWGGPNGSRNAANIPTINFPVVTKNGPGTPIAGVVINARAKGPNGQDVPVSCTTDATGTCNLVVTSAYTDANQSWTVTITSETPPAGDTVSLPSPASRSTVIP